MGGWEKNDTFLILYFFLLLYSKDQLFYFYVGTDIFLLSIFTILTTQLTNKCINKWNKKSTFFSLNQ